MTYPNAAIGLQKLFYAQIIAIAMILVVFIPILGWIAAIVAAVLILIFQITGLNTASADDERYKTALILAVVGMVLSVLSAVIPSALVKNLISIASSALSLAVLFIVVHTTVELLKNAGRNDIASTGNTVLILNIISLGLNFLVTLLNTFSASGLQAVLTIASSVVSLVAGILYIIFLKKSSDAL